jgi:S4 domain
LDSLKITLLFYVNITHRKFQQIARKAKKLEGFFEENYLYLLEGRLVCLSYRSGLVLNMFDAISFVKKGCVKVNGLIIKNLNYVVTVMTIIGFRSICKGFLFLNFWKKIIRKIIFIVPPKFLYFFYKFFFFFLKRSPRRKDFMHPFHLDMYRAIGYGGYAK